VASRLPGKFVLPLGLAICFLLVSYFRTMWGNATDKVTDAVILVLSEELREKVREKRKCGPKHRNWIAHRESLGASNCLFCELSSQNPQEYRQHMGMGVEKFDELLRLVQSYMSKKDTVMKAAIPARLKL